MTGGACRSVVTTVVCYFCCQQGPDYFPTWCHRCGRRFVFVALPLSSLRHLRIHGFMFFFPIVGLCTSGGSSILTASSHLRVDLAALNVQVDSSRQQVRMQRRNRNGRLSGNGNRDFKIFFEIYIFQICTPTFASTAHPQQPKPTSALFGAIVLVVFSPLWSVQRWRKISSLQ